jgi:hypothetical protein
MSHRPREPRRHRAELPWPSFADALAGLLFVFIVTTFVFAIRLMVETRKTQAVRHNLESAEQVARDLLGTAEEQGPLTRCLEGGAISRAVPNPEDLTVALYLPDSAWFEVCKTELGPAQKAAVAAVRRCLVEELGPLWQREAGYALSLGFEGHTDSRPSSGCGAALPSNWELSGARAAGVLRELVCAYDGPAELSARSACEEGGAAPLLELRAAPADRLELVAAGLADRRPAWGALCAKPAEADLAVCAALGAGRDPEPALAAFFSRPEVMDTTCARPVAPDAARTGSDRLRLWANACLVGQDPELRLGPMRRVDLRLQLRPTAAMRQPDEAGPVDL